MSVATLNRLGELISVAKSELIAGWRRQVVQLPSAKHLDRPTLDDHIPDFIDELADALQERQDESIPDALLEGTPPTHGIQRLADGFDLSEVVAEYNILRGTIYDLAEENGIIIRGKTFHILNRVLDTAIGLAVQTYATHRALEVKQRREEYLAFLAHDLRTPLSAASLSATLLELSLESQLQEDPQVALALSTLKRNVRQLEELVAMVLKENTVEAGETPERLVCRHFDCWPHVESVLRDLAPVAEMNNTKLVNEVPNDLVIFADAAMLTRILQNLLSNAIRYTPRGLVTVGAKRALDGSVECSVTDNGMGIPADELDKVFEKFESDDEHADGIGLGLAIVKEFVEAHSGEVSVRSTSGHGSTFRFTLPAKAI